MNAHFAKKGQNYKKSCYANQKNDNFENLGGYDGNKNVFGTGFTISKDIIC